MRVRALSLLCKDGADEDQRRRGIELDVKVELPEFAVTQLRSALKQHFHPDRHQVFSRKGVWRGCLFALPKATLLPQPLLAPALANAVTEPFLDVVVLPTEDDGSLALALAKAQLSVPCLHSCAPFVSELPRRRAPLAPAPTPVPAPSPALTAVKEAATPPCAEGAHAGGEQNGDVNAYASKTVREDGDEEMCEEQLRRHPPPPGNEDSWGLETDVIEMLAESGSPHGPCERRRLARAALRAGDADRLLLCLGRLEGEGPRGTPGGRADAFDDPAAVAERNSRRKEKPASEARRGNGSGGAPQGGAAKEVPMWTPPFPPEEFDNYDDGAGSEGQDFPPHHKTRRSSSGGRLGKRHAAGQQQSADLLEVLRRLLKALGENDDDDGKPATAVVAEDDGVEGCGLGEAREGGDSRAPNSNDAGQLAEEGECLHMECESVDCCDQYEDEDDDDDGDDDFAVAAAALESSCLRSVFRQYLFGVDWRFISAHGLFYLSLLQLLRDILRPTFGPRRSRRSNRGANQRRRQGQQRAANEDEDAEIEVLASFLLKPSTDCRGLVELLESLCIGIDDLVALPPESPPPPPPPSSASPSLLAHPASPLSPPSPATPTSLSLTTHQTNSLKLAVAKSAMTQAAAAAQAAAAQAAAAHTAVGAAATEQSLLPLLAPYSASGSAMPPLATPPWPSSSPTSPPTHTVKVAVQPGLPMSLIHATAPAAAPKSLAVAGENPGSGGTVPPPAPVSAAPTTAFIPGGPQWTLIPPPPPLPPSTKPASTPSAFSPAAHGGVPAAASPPAIGMGVSPSAPGWKSINSPPQLPHMPTPMFAPPSFSPPALGGPGGSSQGSVGEGNPWIIAQQREALEHEQGTALAELARSVLALAKAASAAVNSASVSREGVGAISACPTAAASTNNGRGNGKGKSPAAVVPRCGVGAASKEEGNQDADETVMVDGGAVGVGEGDDRDRNVTAEAPGEEPSEGEHYVGVMADLQFDTMRMEVVHMDIEVEVDVSSSEGKKGEEVSPLSKVKAAQQQQQQRRQRHHFWAVAEAEGPVPSARQRRLVRELRSLARELPLYWGSTIAVRVDEDRPHLLKAMIAAPEGTPYDSGLFEFDIYCPTQYPAVPPRVNLMTTGGGRVRFSPNLYACGNVCLSLLGTWSGSPEMMWSSNASLLQVLLSLQTFILGAQYPYFNEPGLELDFGHEGAMDRARTSPNGGYEVLRPLTVEWAMTEALRSSPRGFETLVREHLWRKKWHILGVMSEWLREARRPGGLLGHYRDLVASLQNFLKELIRLSASMGNCRYSPPSPLQSGLLADPDHQRAEYFAARRGLFGPEAGPPSDDEKRARCDGGVAGGGVEGGGLAGSSGEGSGSGVGEYKGGEGASDAPAGLLSLLPRAEGEGGDGGDEGGRGIVEKERLLQMGEKLRPRNGHGDDGDEMEEEGEEPPCPLARGKIWETPAEARERLQSRLRVVERRMDVAIASSAAAAAMMSAAGSRRPEVWAVAAEKAARSAGVGALHGKALQAEEAEAGGRPGVTWSTHPQFLKYFKLLQLGVPREEVIDRAVRSGVDPSILDHADEEIPLSTQYSIASPSSPLLRVGPDLDSTPVAQLTALSGTIYTAKPTRTLSTLRRPSKISADPSATTLTTPRTVEATTHHSSAPTTQSPDRKASTGASTAGTQPTCVIDNMTINTTSSGSDGAKKEQGSSASASPSASASSREGGSQIVHPSEHPLVLSGRRVWVVSPVVGWASVWAETGQSILSPAGADLDGRGKGSGEGDGGERGPESSGVAAGKGGGSGPGVAKGWKGGKGVKGAGSGGKGGVKEEGEAIGDATKSEGGGDAISGMAEAAATIASLKAKMGKIGKGFGPSSSPMMKLQKTYSFPPPTATTTLPLGFQPSLASASPGPINGVPPWQKLPEGKKYTHPPQPVLPSAPTNGSGAKASTSTVSLETFLWQSQPPQMPTGAAQVHAPAPNPHAHVGPWPDSVNLSAHSTPGSGGPVLDKTGFFPTGFGGNTVGGSGGGGQPSFAMMQWGIGAGSGMINAEEEAKKTE